MKAKIWIAFWFVFVTTALTTVSVCVYRIDPFFHYHKPNTDKYYYELYNQRSQNDGIEKHFDYNALITGTSMTENFRTTEVDKVFGCNSIKVPFSGGSYKEINDNIVKALRANPNLKLIICGLDMDRFMNSADAMRVDLGTYPTYLYDANPFNDLEYLLNRDIFGRSYQMIIESEAKDFIPGITTFDDYSRWQEYFDFGIDNVCPNGITIEKAEKIEHITDDEKSSVKENIEANVIDVARQHPDVDFYYFYPPYSIAWWAGLSNSGTLYKQLEVEKFITELILPYENIHLFSFNNRTDITTDLNNYKDSIHYGCWINSLILKWMHDGRYRLTFDNYKDYLMQEKEFYSTYDYESVNGQEDYEADFYAAAILNHEINGAMPIDVLNSYGTGLSIIRSKRSEDKSVIGFSFIADVDKGYNYVYFKGQKVGDLGDLTVEVLDNNNNLLYENKVNHLDLDNEIHQYVIDLSSFKSDGSVALYCGVTDNNIKPESEFRYSDIWLY